MLDVDGLTFIVSDGFAATKYDEWAFYRNQINRIGGVKAVDLVVVARDASVAYLVEVKNFRVDPVTRERRTRTKPSELPDEMAAKVIHSLGGILAARVRAVVDAERKLAVTICRARALRVVLHLEQSKGTRLFPVVVDPANLLIKLRSLLKAVDPHTLVVSRGNMGDLPWEVA